MVDIYFDTNFLFPPINGGGPVEERDRGPSCREQFVFSTRSGETKQATVSTFFVMQPPCMEDVRMELVL
jgi:hypothetical protein